MMSDVQGKHDGPLWKLVRIKQPKPTWMWENQIPDDRKKVDIESDIVETETTEESATKCPACKSKSGHCSDCPGFWEARQALSSAKASGSDKGSAATPTPQTRDTAIRQILDTHTKQILDNERGYPIETQDYFTANRIQSLITQAFRNGQLDCQNHGIVTNHAHFKEATKNVRKQVWREVYDLMHRKELLDAANDVWQRSCKELESSNND